jgi:hypothetical protein
MAMKLMSRLRSSIGAAALATLAFGSLGGCETTYVFDEITVGEEVANRAPKPRSNSQFLRSVYADLLGRQPEVYDFDITYQGQPYAVFQVDEKGMLLDALDGLGDPDPLRATIVAGLVGSSEVTLPSKEEVADPAAFIAEQFHRFLGRDPGAYELDAFVREWEADPAVGPRAVVRALIGSREYQSQ